MTERLTKEETMKNEKKMKREVRIRKVEPEILIRQVKLRKTKSWKLREINRGRH